MYQLTSIHQVYVLRSQEESEHLLSTLELDSRTTLRFMHAPPPARPPQPTGLAEEQKPPSLPVCTHKPKSQHSRLKSGQICLNVPFRASGIMEKAGISVGLKRGHIVNSKEAVARPAQRRGFLSQRVKKV